MKKSFTLIMLTLIFCLSVCAVSACGQTNGGNSTNGDSNGSSSIGGSDSGLSSGSGSSESGGGSSDTSDSSSGGSSDECNVYGHTFGDWRVVKEATCAENGEEERACEKCGYSEEKTIPKTDNHTEEIIAEVKATCTKSGLTEGKKCSVCGKILVEQKEIEAAGHTYGEWIIDKEATCAENGEKHKKCSKCGDVLTEAVSALGHNYKDGVCKRCGQTDPTLETYVIEGDYVYFGSYPQTNVGDESLVSALNEAAGALPTAEKNNNWTCYYYYEASVKSAYAWYQDIEYNGEKYRGVYFTKYRPAECDARCSSDNSYQDNNGYYESTAYWFKFEKIKWKILSREKNKLFLFCETVIDSQQYYYKSNGTRKISGITVNPNNYEYSEIRTWLNETFYNAAFNVLQKKSIALSLVDNGSLSAGINTPIDNSSTGGDNSRRTTNNTKDKVFLLSYQEATTADYGFDESSGSAARKKTASDYAKSQGCHSNGRYPAGHYDWLMRDVDSNTAQVAAINYAGEKIYNGLYCSNSAYGVVPALWLYTSDPENEYLHADNDKKYTATADGKYIYFGSYPQTKIDDQTVVSKLNEKAGKLPTCANSYNWHNYKYYYLGGCALPYMWYQDVEYGGERYRGVYFTSYRPFSCGEGHIEGYIFQKANGYSLSTVYWFKFEDIKWRVLNKSGSKALLLCETAIDSKHVYNNNYNRVIDGAAVARNNYAYSEIREWLNETFYKTAFNDLQKSLIEITNVDNSLESTLTTENSYVCQNTNDKIFLPSAKDIATESYGFNGSIDVADNARAFKSSDYAKSQGCWTLTGTGEGNCYMLLRSPSQQYGGVFLIGGDGRINSGYGDPQYTFFGIVPALQLNLK